MSFANAVLLFCEAAAYFGTMALLFRMRHRYGLGIFLCALGTMHFLETYLAAILYLPAFFGTAISPGSSVLFSGKLVLLLLLYIREDAATVRQPIYGLLIGNLLLMGLVILLRYHEVVPPVPGRTPDFAFMNEMGWLMIWGTLLLFVDSILIILLYERLAAWLGHRIGLRIWLSATAVLTLDQLGFYTALYLLFGAPLNVLAGGWIAKMAFAMLYAVFAAAYLYLFERTPIPLRQGRSLSDVFDLLTYRERYEALLERSGRDGLTGLLDRGRFEARAREIILGAVRARRPLTLLIIDADHFKSINDRFGHATGDAVLQEIARRLSAGLRHTDCLYRYGGEEFALICDGLCHIEGMAIAERLRSGIEEHPIDGLSERVTISIGVASIPEDGHDLDSLFAIADKRLYEAKIQGRNRVSGAEHVIAAGQPGTPGAVPTTQGV